MFLNTILTSHANQVKYIHIQNAQKESLKTSKNLHTKLYNPLDKFYNCDIILLNHKGGDTYEKKRIQPCAYGRCYKSCR